MTDLDFRNVAQDDPQFITYIRAVHLHFPSSSPGIIRNFVVDPPPQTKLVAKLLQFKVVASQTIVSRLYASITL